MTEVENGARYPRSYVGLDLETTGVDHRSDAIMEVGAVKFEDGEVVGTFSTFVDPLREIPSDVVYLTGITDEDVSGAPTIDEVLPDLVEFVGDLPVVAHQASFDVNFLAAAAGGDAGLLVGGGGVFDTLALSRALLPRLPSHRLSALVRFFDLEGGQAHRAGDDAMAVGLLFGSLLGLLAETGSAVLSRMASLADPQIKLLLDAAIEDTRDRLDPFALPDHGDRESELLRYDNASRIDIDRTPTAEKIEVDLDEVESLFQVDGRIGSRLPGYEIRREQLQMLRAVGDALSSGVHLLVEAGTGVGKSLAYLVPAAYFAAMNGERVVVSTNTRNLQEQLFRKDVPFLAEALDVPFSAALLKGRSNYLCLQRWMQVLDRGLTAAERAALLPLVVWEMETNSGDISENAAFRGWGYLWNRVSAEAGPCLGQRCPLNDRCYLQRARRAAQAAHIVVVNHSLLFSDTEADNKVLGEYGYLICDEAHNIESAATEHLGRRVNVWRARAALDNLYRADGGESGDLPDLLASVASSDESGTVSAVREAGERLKEQVADAAEATDAFFRALSARHEDLNNGRPVEFGKLRYHPGLSVASVVGPELEFLVERLSEVSRSAADLADLVADADIERAEALYQGLIFHSTRIADVADDLEYLAGAEDADGVFWLSVKTFREVAECEMRSAPVSVAEKMGDFLYSRVDSITMTSATLTVDQSFDFMMERLGLDLLPDWKVIPLAVGSPYDYDEQSVVVVASHLPQPSSPGFNNVVADIVIELAARAVGGTLVLFTSRSSLDAVFKAVRDPLTARGKLVLGQGHGGGVVALLERFSREVDSVLLATSSFWEGVDVPGRSLEQLIIVKLPFPVPRDPVVEAHCERYEAEGGNSFSDYMVPRTAIRLRQGFGRLIRSTTDMGAVVFLDSRLATRQYGRRLLRELPTRAIVAGSDRELLAALRGIHAEQGSR